MMNFSSLKNAEPKKRNFFALCLVILFVVFFGLMMVIFRESSFLDRSTEGLGRNSQSQPATLVEAEPSFERMIEETRYITGVVQQTVSSKDGELRSFTVNAFVIDREHLPSVTADEQPAELPMIERLFQVSVVPETPVFGLDSLNAIVSGDFLRVFVREGVYESEQLSADRIEKVGSTLISQ